MRQLSTYALIEARRCCRKLRTAGSRSRPMARSYALVCGFELSEPRQHPGASGPIRLILAEPDVVFHLVERGQCRSSATRLRDDHCAIDRHDRGGRHRQERVVQLLYCAPVGPAGAAPNDMGRLHGGLELIPSDTAEPARVEQDRLCLVDHEARPMPLDPAAITARTPQPRHVLHRGARACAASTPADRGLRVLREEATRRAARARWLPRRDSAGALPFQRDRTSLPRRWRRWRRARRPGAGRARRGRAHETECRPA